MNANLLTLSTPLSGTAGSQALAAATTYLAIGFVAPANKTVSSVSLYCSAVSAPGTVSAEIYSNVNSGANVGKPDASLSTPVSITPAAGWNTWTGINQAVTGGNRYHIVLKGPASGSATVAWLSGVDMWLTGDHINRWSTGKWHSTDSGATWVTAVTSITGFIVNFTDGTTLALPFNVTTYVNSVSNGAEAGVEFTVPNGYFVLNGAAFHINNNGTPTGALSYRIYKNKSLLAETYSCPAGIAGSYGRLPLMFPNEVVLGPGTYQLMYRNAVSEPGGYRCLAFNAMPSDAASVAARPFQAVAATLTGGTWAYTNGYMPMFALLLDVGKPLVSPPLNRRKYTNQR